eukprot:CAMPEP_0206024630 /NCGR_PEP_ID=MMETSP1464-20131121/38522_1 /ASSEMBLY_ACC=CAM_ASM_001124 /TAXON_ID=119497 /ORGANISM="Exanthemachrysis gayraliae, Strain RCC1523" /LENGTH=65 /DNA_ID=CAMNT_0053398647 /DNA_START=205 /DNA_END=399 /DNA_ORIENTATION=+
MALGNVGQGRPWADHHVGPQSDVHVVGRFSEPLCVLCSGDEAVRDVGELHNRGRDATLVRVSQRL